MIVKLLTEHHLEFRSLKGGCRGSSESTLLKTPNCWKSHATAHIDLRFGIGLHDLRFGIGLHVHSALSQITLLPFLHATSWQSWTSTHLSE